MNLGGYSTPHNFEEAQLALEEAYHRSQYGDRQTASEVILSVAPFLIDWGYAELAEQNILQVLKNSQDPNLTAPSFAYMGSIADLRSDYTKALAYFHQSLKIFESVQKMDGVTGVLFRIGRIYNQRLEFKKAREYLERCIKLCQDHGVTEGWAAALLALGWNMQQQTTEIEDALNLYQQSIQRAQESRDFETLSSAHKEIGFSLWLRRQQKEEARQYVERALQISKEHNLVKVIGGTYATMGYLHVEWEEYAEAEESCRQAIQIFQAVGNSDGLSSAYVNLGRVYESRHDFESAAIWYNQSHELSIEISNPGSQAYASLCLGKVRRKQGQLAEAEKNLLEAVRISQDHNLIDTLTEAQNELSQIRDSQN